eukprot:Rhum_TRINITY_DN12152_c0_g1::Rhum_TRINITY_DN12152_c0_g1_i1::g.49628::m.49628
MEDLCESVGFSPSLVRESGSSAPEEGEGWEHVDVSPSDAAATDSYNMADQTCPLVALQHNRRRVTTAAALSEHVYKISDKRYTEETSLHRLRLLCTHFPDLISLEGSIEVVAGGNGAPPVVVAEDVDTVYIAYRGTHHLSDWLSGVHIGSTRLPEAPEGCELHKGFYTRCTRYANDATHAVVQQGLEKGKSVVMTGHSLGGAVAAIKTVEALLQRRDWLLRQQLQAQQEGDTVQGVSAVTFAAPYWACRGLAAFLSSDEGAGVSQSVHNFFNPADRVAVCASSVGFAPVGYFYYTGHAMIEKGWLSRQFSKAHPTAAATVEDGAIRSASFVHSTEGTLTTLAAAAVCVVLLSGGSVVAAPPSFSHVDVDTLKAHAKRRAGSSAGKVRIRDFTIPYFMDLRYNRGAVVREGHEATRVVLETELRIGAASGIFRTASPTSDLFSAARAPSILTGSRGYAAVGGGASSLSGLPPPVTFREARHKVMVTLQPHSSGKAVVYLVDGKNPRPPMLRLVYERTYDGHIVRFPELGPDKAAVMHASAESVDALRGIVALCEAVGVQHNIPLRQRAGVLSWAQRAVKQAASTVKKLKDVASNATTAVHVVKEPHRIQVFVLACLITWGAREVQPGRAPALSLTLQQSVSAESLCSLASFESDEEEEEEEEEEDAEEASAVGEEEEEVVVVVERSNEDASQTPQASPSSH